MTFLRSLHPRVLMALIATGSTGSLILSISACEPPVATPNCGPDAGPGVTATLVPAGNSIGHVFTDSQYAYFLEETTTSVWQVTARAALHRVPLCGGAVESVGEAFGFAPNSTALMHQSAFGGGYFYTAGRPLVRTRVSDGAHSQLPIDLGCTGDLEANATHVYVYDTCQDKILRATHTSAELEVFVEAADHYELALSSDTLFYAHGGALLRRPLAGGEATPFYIGRPVALAADSRAVFIAHTPNPTTLEVQIRRIPLGGGSMQDLGAALFKPLPQTSFFHNDNLVLQGGHAYFRTRTSDGEQLVRVSSADGAVTAVADVSAVTHFAAAGERVYWSASGGLFSRQP